MDEAKKRFSDDHQPMQLIIEHIQKLAGEFCGVSDWGREAGDSEIKAIEILNVIDRDDLPVRVIGRTIFENGFRIEISVTEKVKSWRKLQHIMYYIIAEVAEKVLVLSQEVDDTYFYYWFLTGVLTGQAEHGHIGCICMKIDNVRHLNERYF